MIDALAPLSDNISILRSFKFRLSYVVPRKI